MYNSPIRIITSDLGMKMAEKFDEDIYQAALDVGINVDKEELLRALQYDRGQYEKGYADGMKEFAKKLGECLKRYSHLHKYADEAKHSTEKFADGTPMEMISVWDVFPLEKWGMVEYETMNTLQENIEIIAKERLLTEFEKDLRIITKEMVGVINA